MNNRYQVAQYVPIKNADATSYYNQGGYPSTYINGNDERLAGGFVFPFLLGGVTGAALAPAFWRPNYGYNRPIYYPPMPGPYPYPPRRWF